MQIRSGLYLLNNREVKYSHVLVNFYFYYLCYIIIWFGFWVGILQRILKCTSSVVQKNSTGNIIIPIKYIEIQWRFQGILSSAVQSHGLNLISESIKVYFCRKKSAQPVSTFIVWEFFISHFLIDYTDWGCYEIRTLEFQVHFICKIRL